MYVHWWYARDVESSAGPEATRALFGSWGKDAAVDITRYTDEDAIEANILDVLAHRTEPFHPNDLILQLEAAGYRNDDVRAAIWQLLDRKRVRLTTDLRLVIPTMTPIRTSPQP